jgi:hypothetical protein
MNQSPQNITDRYQTRDAWLLHRATERKKAQYDSLRMRRRQLIKRQHAYHRLVMVEVKILYTASSSATLPTRDKASTYRHQ